MTQPSPPFLETNFARRITKPFLLAGTTQAALCCSLFLFGFAPTSLGTIEASLIRPKIGSSVKVVNQGGVSGTTHPVPAMGAKQQNASVKTTGMDGENYLIGRDGESSSGDRQLPRQNERRIVVPFRFIANFIILSVRLNENAEPVSLVLDSGANNFLSPEIATKLGLTPEGSYQSYGAGSRSVSGGVAKVQTMKIGSLSVHNQSFYVVPLPYALQHAWNPEIVGGLGYQFLREQAVRVDFERKTLTFYRPIDLGALHPGKRQTAAPFYLHERVPTVAGEVDGFAGDFQIDTGSDGSLALFAPFVAGHDLKNFYSAQLHGFSGEGIGGRESAFFARSRVFKIGSGAGVKGMTVELLQDTAGIGADTEVDGNIGMAILKQFNILFDYPHRCIYLEKNSNYGRRDVFNRTGMAPRITPDGLRVMTVFQGSPAARAGIEKGDLILGINGSSGSQLNAVFLEKVFRQRPGTVLRLHILHHEKDEHVAIRLQELLK